MKREHEKAPLAMQGKLCRGLHLTERGGGGGQEGVRTVPPPGGALSAGRETVARSRGGGSGLHVDEKGLDCGSGPPMH